MSKSQDIPSGSLNNLNLDGLSGHKDLFALMPRHLFNVFSVHLDERRTLSLRYGCPENALVYVEETGLHVDRGRLVYSLVSILNHLTVP